MQVGYWSMVLWISGFALTFTLFLVLLYKKRYRTIPWFTLLIGQDVLQTLVLFSLRRLPLANFYTYYAFEVVDSILRVLVIWEVARILIERHLGLPLYDEIRSYWAAFVVIVVMCISCVIFSSKVTPFWPARIVLRVGEVSTVGVGGLLLMVLWLTFFFGIKARVHAQAIVYGLALYLFGKFVVEGVVIMLGIRALAEAGWWLRFLYHGSLLIWIVCLWQEEPDRALSDRMYAMVRWGRAGINPPLPQSVIEEYAQHRRRLVFSSDGREAATNTATDVMDACDPAS